MTVTDKFDIMADEADKYADLLANMADIDLSILRHGLRNEYDVIVSEAMDYLITLNLVDEFKEDLAELSDRQDSYLISGRLRMCAALSKDQKLKNVLSVPKCDKDDLYCQVWESASCYVSSPQQRWLKKLETLARNPDNTVASLARSLLDFLSSK